MTLHRHQRKLSSHLERAERVDRFCDGPIVTVGWSWSIRKHGGRVATLVIDTGSGPEQTFEISDESISIGASASNDVVLRVPGVAPNHLVIRRSGTRFTFLGQQRQVVYTASKVCVKCHSKPRVVRAAVKGHPVVLHDARRLELQRSVQEGDLLQDAALNVVGARDQRAVIRQIYR